MNKIDIKSEQEIESNDLRKTEDGFYLDAFNKRFSYKGIKTLKPRDVKLSLSEWHVSEIVKCTMSFEYFLFNYCKIMTKKGYARPELREYQIRMLNDLQEYKRNVCLFPRQQGKTVTTSTYLLWRALFGGGDLNIGIAAQKWSMAIEVLDKIKETYLTLPIWMQQGITLWNRTSIKLENGAVFITSTANGDAFRGFSIRLLFCDEIGFVKPTKWKDFEDAVFPSTSSFDDAQIIMCSTPNGMNHFYDFVEGAKNNTNGYKLTRADWWEHPDRTQEWADRVISENGIIFFNQNYGLDFIGSSYTLVDGFVLSNIKPIEPELVNKFVDGFKIFNRVENEHKYILSVDSAKDGSDEFSMHVIDITSMPFKQVACSNIQINYLEMPPVIKDIAEYYNNAHVIIENVEGSGQSCVDQLYIIYEYNNIYKDKGKRYYGFRTTKSSRRNILNMMRFFIEEKKLIINDKETKTQLLNFIKINNKYQADDGCKDDLVMALAIAFVPFQNIRNFEDLPKFLEMIKEDISDDSESKKIEDFVSFGYFDDATEVDNINNEQVYISGFL